MATVIFTLILASANVDKSEVWGSVYKGPPEKPAISLKEDLSHR